MLDLDPGTGHPPEVEVERGSVCDPADVRRALRGVDRLFHLAGNPNLWAPDPREFFDVNHGGTRVVLAEAARVDLERIVCTSTESILKGPGAPRDPLGESARPRLAEMPGPYCRSKYFAQQAALAAARQGQRVVVVNPTLPVGPGDRRLTPPTRMLLDFLNGRAPAYLDCELNLVDVRDVAAGHLLAAEKGRVGECYILGHENLRLRTLLGLLHELTGLPMPRLRVPYPVALSVAALSELAAILTRRPPRASLTGVRLARSPTAFDAGKAVQELGLPQSPIRRALGDAVAWFQAEGLLRRRPRLVLAGDPA